MLQPVVRVGEWLVTPSVNQISRKGRQLTLEPRLIDLLVFFARHPGEVLSRDELIENVWTRNVVTSHVVTQSISELRKSLKDGDDVSLEYIATVPKRGYKLTVPVIWCTEEGEELAPSMEALTPSPSTAVPAPPAAGAPSDVSVPLPDAAAPPPAPTVASAPSGRKRLTTAPCGAVPVGAGHLRGAGGAVEHGIAAAGQQGASAAQSARYRYPPGEWQLLR